MQDFRYALRSLRKQPIFTLVAVATLTLGIGANTAIFSLLYQYMLRPLPYPDAERLVFIWNTYPLMGLQQASVSIPDYIDRKTQASAIEDATLFTDARIEPGRRGRAGPGSRSGGHAVVLYDAAAAALPRPGVRRGGGAAWRRQVRDPDLQRCGIPALPPIESIVGRTVRLGGEAYQIVGVLPADFELPSRDVAVLVPFSFTPQQMSDQGRGNEFSQMIARLKPGATLEQVNAQMKIIVDRNLERLPQRQAFAKTSGFGGFSVPIRDAARRRPSHAALLPAGCSSCWSF